MVTPGSPFVAGANVPFIITASRRRSPYTYTGFAPLPVGGMAAAGSAATSVPEAVGGVVQAGSIAGGMAASESATRNRRSGCVLNVGPYPLGDTTYNCVFDIADLYFILQYVSSKTANFADANGASFKVRIYFPRCS